MVGRMARRVDTLDRPTVPFEDFPADHRDIRREVHVSALLDLDAVRNLAGAMRPEADGRCVRVSGQEAASGRVVHVRMRHKHVRDGLALCGTRNRFDVHGIRRARVDHGNVATSQDVGAGTVECERTRIASDHATYARAQFRHLAIGKVQFALERNVCQLSDLLGEHLCVGSPF